jgi:hypothetical protein
LGGKQGGGLFPGFNSLPLRFSPISEGKISLFLADSTELFPTSLAKTFAIPAFFTTFVRL